MICTTLTHVGLVALSSVLGIGQTPTLTVTGLNNGPMATSNFLITLQPSGKYRVEIVAAASLDLINPTFEVRGSGGEDIEEVIVTKINGQNWNVSVLSSGGAGIGDVDLIHEQQILNTHMLVKEVKVNGSIGSIDVDGIGTITSVFGSITGTIEAHGDGTDFFGSPFNPLLRDIDVIKALNGSVTGTIRSQRGEIESIAAQGMGTDATNRATIEANMGIDSIVITNDIFADIDARKPAGLLGLSGPGGIRNIQCDTFDGTINTRRIDLNPAGSNRSGQFLFTSTFKGTILIGESFNSGTEEDAGGQTITANRRIETGANGFLGQVIINAADFFIGEWNGGVAKAGTIQVTMPEYPDLPSALGGGSIAVAPYTLHEQASFPVHNAVYVDDDTILTVKVRFYGPVSIPATITATNFPFSIDQSINGISSWGPVSNPDQKFDIFVDPMEPNIVQIREINLLGFFATGFYRFQPRFNVLSEGIEVPTSVALTGQELIFKHFQLLPPPPPPPNPCESCNCPITCLFLCLPCFGFSSSTAGLDFVSNTNGRAVTSTNRPDAHASPDIDRDDDVDRDDLSLLMVSFGCFDCIDLDGDWDQDADDLEVLMAAYTGPASPSVK